jgi:hypothetical protein
MSIPYDEIDLAIRELCRAINEFPDIVTSDSCQGFVDGHRLGKPWSVYFKPNGLPTLDAYASIEFLAYICGREAHAAGFDTRLGAAAPPPVLNGVCQSMYFYIECLNSHPDNFAGFVRKMRDEFFALVERDPDAA